MLYKLYKIGTDLIAPTIGFYLNHRLARGKEEKEYLAQRRGEYDLARPDGKLIWCHGASVGESLSVLALIDHLLERDPKLNILVTTGTVTSAKLMRDRLPNRAQHVYMPLDRVAYAKRFLDHFKPDAALWVESEIWPNILHQIKARQIPAALINARMSERSFKRWGYISSVIKDILSVFDIILAQSKGDQKRLASLSGKETFNLGNLKFSSSPLPVDHDELLAIQKRVDKRPIWIFSSTHEGEEEFALQAHHYLKQKFDTPLSIIAPRNPSRGNDIEILCKKESLSCKKRSIGTLPDADTDIYIADTMGELGLFYRLCDVVIVGGSFIPHGGHNPIEPAHLDCAIAYGPHMHNFIDIKDMLEQAKATQTIASGTSLGCFIEEMWQNDKALQSSAKRAKQVATEQMQVLDRVADCITPLFNSSYVKPTEEIERVSGIFSLSSPSFWYRDNSWQEKVLAPASHAYKIVDNHVREKRRQSQYESSLEIICVGNVSVGGSGKTPVALSLAQIAKKNKRSVCFLTRGYGGEEEGPLLISSPDQYSAQKIGDEAILLAKEGHVCISSDRIAGAKLIEQKLGKKNPIIIMDDGFQNPSLKKDLSLLVFYGAKGIGNGATIPAGPLREPLEDALERTDAVIIIGEDKHNLKASIHDDIPVLRGTFTTKNKRVKAKKGQDYIAFAGIGQNEKFFHSCRQNNYHLIDCYSYPDHYDYPPTELDNLLREASARDAKLITTEKDAARLRKYYREHVLTLPIELEWQDDPTHLLSRFFVKKKAA